MDDKVSYTYPILLMIIIAPRHAPKGGASVVTGACFLHPAMGFRRAPCLNLRISKPCCAKKIFSADAVLTPTVRALTAHSAGANQPFRSSASQPAQLVQKREVAYHLRLSEIGRRAS